MIKEAHEKFLANFKVDTNNKVIVGETLKITITTSNAGGRHRQAARHDPLSFAPWTVQHIDAKVDFERGRALS